MGPDARDAPFGPLTDAQWRHPTVTGATQHEDGSWGHAPVPMAEDQIRAVRDFSFTGKPSGQRSA